MAKLKLQGKDLRKIGYPQDKAIGVAIQVMHQHYKHHSLEDALTVLKEVLENPEAFTEDEFLGKIAVALIGKKVQEGLTFSLIDEAREYAIYGEAHIDAGARSQMDIAIRLPVSVAGALMPDAHQGYGLPIGGVLATENAVIPYGVGVDIGCRMCMTIFDMSEDVFARYASPLKKALLDNTNFGTGGEIKERSEHTIFERDEFKTIPLVRDLQNKAYRQLGTSGSGNHFVEFGLIEIMRADNDMNLAPGKYVALLSHSGSRGLGATIAGHYTRLAMQLTQLPKEAKHLAWLSLDTQEGLEYWAAMNLAGDYASACHHRIHDRIAKAIGFEPLARIENHHNFAWKEIVDGRELIVHRKGATPAGKGVLGIIPGSMTAPGFVVRGKGDVASIQSASHGAGRQMSRTKAMQAVTANALKTMLKDHGVTLIGGGTDEAPQAYKDIHTVMRAQEDLVEVLGMFTPKIVRMDG
jgi:tRNA-splicing ligase RtcB (3'-phosphate/5'-hydroxy nucleic acid ligase)